MVKPSVKNVTRIVQDHFGSVTRPFEQTSRASLDFDHL